MAGAREHVFQDARSQPELLRFLDQALAPAVAPVASFDALAAAQQDGQFFASTAAEGSAAAAAFDAVASAERFVGRFVRLTAAVAAASNLQPNAVYLFRVRMLRG